ncbi:MAG: nucleoside monophosphate kinase [Candidatus Paceibacterota bacterium]|jgi:adenylate kinase
MDTRTIFFIGKPGCGKGTQAKLLSEKTGWPVFASGKLFRAIAQEDTPVGHKMKAENDAGVLAPHWFAMYLYLNSLFSIPDGQSAIFDGFNRKVPEAELVLDSLQWLGRPCTILNIKVSDEEVRRRLVLRKEMEGRTDDAVVEERLKEYEAHTAPAIEFFRTAGALIEINGEQTPEEIAVDIRAALSIK